VHGLDAEKVAADYESFVQNVVSPIMGILNEAADLIETVERVSATCWRSIVSQNS